MFLNCPTWFGRHTAHHQELKNCNCSLWFYVRFWLLRWLSHHSGRQPQTYLKLKAAITVFELLMLGGVSSETCWAIKKHLNNKLYYTVAFCWFFPWVLYYDARIHEHQIYWDKDSYCSELCEIVPWDLQIKFIRKYWKIRFSVIFGILSVCFIKICMKYIVLKLYEGLHIVWGTILNLLNCNTFGRYDLTCVVCVDSLKA
jgi:hypothetical protein